MNNKKNKYGVVKAISWYAVGNVFVKSISFFVLPLLTKLMSTADYGVYTIFHSYSVIIDSIVVFGLSPTIRMAKNDVDTNYDSYTKTILIIPFIITLFLYLIVNVFYVATGSLLKLNLTTWNLLLLFSLTNVLCIILSGKLVLDGKYKSYFVYLLINTVIGLGTFFILAKTLFISGSVYYARILGLIIGNVSSILFLLANLYDKKMSKVYITKGIRWGAPLVVHSFTISLFGQLDTILIDVMSDFSNTGIYGMAVTLSIIPAMFESTMESVWSPWFFGKIKNYDSNTVKKGNNWYLLICMICFVEFMLISPTIMYFLDGAYRECIYYLLPLTINYFIELVYLIPLNVQYYRKNTKYVMTATIISTLIDAILIYLFIKLFGFIGAVYAKTIAKVMLVIIHNYFAKILDKNKYFDFKIVSICLMVLFIFDLLISKVLINIPLIRISLFIVIAILLLFGIIRKKDILLNMFNEE